MRSRAASLFTRTGLLSLLALGPGLAQAQVVNPNRLGILRWYGGNEAAEITVGSNPGSLAFDGDHIWVGVGGNAIKKIRASDGAELGSFPVPSPTAVAFDGANVWVASWTDGTVTKLRASDGASMGSFPVGTNPGGGMVFDGANIWVANYGSGDLTKLRAADGGFLGTFAVGAGPATMAF